LARGKSLAGSLAMHDWPRIGRRFIAHLFPLQHILTHWLGGRKSKGIGNFLWLWNKKRVGFDIIHG
jgi:hypothetical protein